MTLCTEHPAPYQEGLRRAVLLLQMWGQVFTHVITALLLFQVIMAALLAIKQSFSAILVIS